MTKKRILLITRYFPPLDGIATLRMYSWAKYLHHAGCDVSILTTTKKKQVCIPLEVDTSFCDVCEVDYFDPIVAVGFDKGHQQKKEQLCLPAKGFKAKLKQRLVRFYQERMNERMPNRSDPWIFPAIRELKKRQQKGLTYDVIISSYGPPSAHIVGAYAKKLFKGVWVADYRDLWLENDLYKGLWPFTWLERWIEQRWVRRANLITTVSQGLADVLKKKFYTTPVEIIENGFDSELIDTVPKDFFSGHKKKLRLVYTGSIFRGKRDPTPLFKAIQILLKEGKASIDTMEVLFFGSCMGDLQELIDKHQVASVVSYGGVLSQYDAYRAQKSADVLLFLEDPKPAVNGILTGKLFEYLYVGTPILGIGVTPQTAAGQLILDMKAGTVFGTEAAKIRDYLALALQNQDQALSKTIDKTKLARFSRKEQVNRLLQLLRMIC